MAPAVVLAGLAAPLAGLVLLVAAPELDVAWEHHPSHFWLVLAAGLLNAVLAYATGVAARRRDDARVLLVSLGFLAAAGFLGLHALATPRVLLEDPNTGFAMATPIGLLVAGAFAAASAADLGPEAARRVVARAGLLQGALLALMAAWAVVSLAGLAPLDDPSAPERASGPLVVLAAAGIGLYAFAVVRYVALHRRRPAPMLLGMAFAFALLAEAMAAVAVGRNWHATWWEWHLLMLAAFGVVASSAQRQWHEERFSDLYLADTMTGRRELTVLFADLAGFTRFAERHEPEHVSAMLNHFFDVAIPPIVRRHGGRVDRLVGDALMATFAEQDGAEDHAVRAARAGLAIQEATRAIAAEHPDWPRFRVGLNTGEVVTTVLGTEGGRTFTVIGDAVNLASRIEGAAPVGGVAVGPETARRLTGARLESLGALALKGKDEPVEVHRLDALADALG
ncbi:MAG TPA: adenylate/guanylate cyclase domain-containing protein [Baekduia sp.]|nr:adenylate/guanylate cyclase domain-containing protein [Baekduia sp.]